MKIHGQAYRTIWLAQDGWRVTVIDQTRLPFRFETVTLGSAEQAADAIKTMIVRGAPLIGATGAYGVALAMRADPSDEALDGGGSPAGRDAADGGQSALGARRMRRLAAAWRRKRARCRPPMPRPPVLCDEDVALCRAIGEHGLPSSARSRRASRRASRSTS
jgi:methylthioribose-1-phosphate isomerase